MKHWFEKLINLTLGEQELASTDVGAELPEHLQPVVWLLGKTGAGKTSLIQGLTGVEGAQVGNGFEPCTRCSQEFKFPQSRPLIRFLDTRGLGEVQYDPEEDINRCLKSSHAVLIVARIDDPVQFDVAQVVKRIRQKAPQTPFVLVSTGADLTPDAEQRKRAIQSQLEQFEAAAGNKLVNVEVSMPPPKPGMDSPGIHELFDQLTLLLPEVALVLLQDNELDQEGIAFSKIRGVVMRYAYSAGAADLTPVVGAFAAPTVQAAMLRAVGEQYGVVWSKRQLSEFTVALGVGVLARYGTSYLTRQLTKLIPGLGQTIGAVTSGTISFATTYAMGRAAAYYLYFAKLGKLVNQQQLRELYQNALQQAVKAARDERQGKK